MRRIRFFTARPRPPFAWSVFGVRIGAFTGAVGLAGFAPLIVLQNADMLLMGWIICGITVLLALIVAWWLTSMTPPRPGLALREGTQLSLLRRRLASPEWSNNRRWPSPIQARHGNIVILKNGDAWVNFLVEGINFSAHNLDSIEAAQRANARLFDALSRLTFIHEVHLRTIKVRVPAETLTRRCIDYVPGWQEAESTWYKAAHEGLTNFTKMYSTGQRNSFERTYWLAVKVGSVELKFYERLLDAIGLATPQTGINTQEVQNRERQVLAALPEAFKAHRTKPTDLDWILKRASTLGLSGATVPTMPPRDHKPTMVAGNNNFESVTITTGHEVDAVTDLFVANCAEQSQGVITRLRRIFRDGVLHRYRSLRRESSIAVHRPGSRTPDLPDGYTSYQALLTLASGPSMNGSYAIQKMTGITDGFHELDADCSIRVTYTPLPGRKAAKVLGKAQRRNDADDESLSRSEFDAVEYAEKDVQLRALYGSASAENMLANVHITFAFGDANHQRLEQKVRNVIDEMAASNDSSEDSFQLYRHVGSQVELWQTMLPCTHATALIEDTRLSQTPALLGALMPLRRQTLGDPYGWPIGVNLENALGQVVYLDLVNPTAGGDGSILIYGEQGTGKGVFFKQVIGAVYDLLGEVWVVDPVGEYEVYAGQFPGAISVDLVNPKVSLDLLKCLPPDEAVPAWLDTWAPLLRAELDSAEYERLAMVIAPGYREVHHSPSSQSAGLRTTRQVFDHIAGSGDDTSRELRRRFNAIKALPGAACLLDPVSLDTGMVDELPAFNASESRFVVFNTRQYVLREGDTATETSNRLATAVFTTIAALAKFYFDRSQRVNLFGMDEAHSYDVPIIKRNILADTNKKGRKFKNIVIVSDQTVPEGGDGLDLVAKRGSFRQRDTHNAVPALRRVHVTPTPKALNLMANDLSPIADTSDLDAGGPNRPIPGREGEMLWYDGRTVGKMQTYLPFIPSRAAAADTRPDKIVRVDDHRASGQSSGQPHPTAPTEPAVVDAGHRRVEGNGHPRADGRHHVR